MISWGPYVVQTFREVNEAFKFLEKALLSALKRSDIPLTSKGDILVSDGSGFAKLAVGSNTQVLTADSTTDTGIKWAAASGGGGADEEARRLAWVL